MSEEPAEQDERTVAQRAEEAADRAERAEHAAEEAEHAADAERQHNERLAARLYAQWAQLREDRQAQLTPPAPVASGPVSRKVEVPYGVDLAASWGWRLLVIVAAGWCLFKALGFLEVVVVPVVIALLISALVVPLVGILQRIGLPRGLASLLVVIVVIAIVGSLLFFAGHQVATGASDLADQTVKGLDEIRNWLKNGPLHASDSQINTWIDRLQHEVTKAGSGGNPLGKVTEVGGVAADVLASVFIVLFSTYFFLAEGDQIWSWVVRLTPRAARGRVDSSGRVAWISLTQFVRATVIVAAVDAIGIMIVAAILRVPFVAAIGVLVFLGAFVPLIGATVAGTVAVLVALVDHGLVTALFMLGGVILVQQLEAHGLQPFLMGRWVSVHPLAVIISIATGVLVAGVAGALVAVPLAAALNAVGQHLAAESAPPGEGGGPPPDAERDEGALLTEGERQEFQEAQEGSTHE
jgi:predicted PurR-regulated permease PerM